MSAKQTRRKDKGLPDNGGRFASTEHAEADSSVSLTPATRRLPYATMGKVIKHRAFEDFNAVGISGNSTIQLSGPNDTDLDIDVNGASDEYEVQEKVIDALNRFSPYQRFADTWNHSMDPTDYEAQLAADKEAFREAARKLSAVPENVNRSASALDIRLGGNSKDERWVAGRYGEEDLVLPVRYDDSDDTQTTMRNIARQLADSEVGRDAPEQEDIDFWHEQATRITEAYGTDKFLPSLEEVEKEQRKAWAQSSREQAQAAADWASERIDYPTPDFPEWVEGPKVEVGDNTMTITYDDDPEDFLVVRDLGDETIIEYGALERDLPRNWDNWPEGDLEKLNEAAFDTFNRYQIAKRKLDDQRAAEENAVLTNFALGR